TANGGPQGERSESIPPSPPYYERMLLINMRFFFCASFRHAIQYAITVWLAKTSDSLLPFHLVASAPG
ncbi:TPA: hypothetical protein ACGD5H_005066, partial [Serratia marcescens]